MIQNQRAYLHPDSIELTIITDVYKKIEVQEGDESFEDYVLVKKDVKSKETIWKNEITSVKEVINEKGNIRTKRIQINLRNRDPLIVSGTYKEFRDLLFKNNTAVSSDPAGFKI